MFSHRVFTIQRVKKSYSLSCAFEASLPSCLIDNGVPENKIYLQGKLILDTFFPFFDIDIDNNRIEVFLNELVELRGLYSSGLPCGFPLRAGPVHVLTVD